MHMCRGISAKPELPIFFFFLNWSHLYVFSLNILRFGSVKTQPQNQYYRVIVYLESWK